MMFLGATPVNDQEAEALIGQAFASAEGQDWSAAVVYLESAAMMASPKILDGIIETLGIFYVRANQYLKLAHLIGFATRLSPMLVIGGLLVERNRQCGLRVPAHPYSLPDVQKALRQYLSEGQYSFAELGIIASLLTQTGHASLAVVLLDALIDMAPAQAQPDLGLDEELVSAVLSLALEKKMKREAEALVHKLGFLAGKWPLRAARWRILLGKADLNSVGEGEDKVTDFLRRRAHASRSGASNKGGKRGD